MADGLSPADFLSWDDAFLQQVSEGGSEVLWTWESTHPFVVVGRGQKVECEVNQVACGQEGIPILRRSSGGGAVVQGPGCLNYGLALRISEHHSLATLSETNRWIMGKQLNALQRVTQEPLVVRGHTDLAVVRDGIERKFSGNAQRRQKDAILFHGTLLYDADLHAIARWLAFPSQEPAYRKGRDHLEFVTNLKKNPDDLISAFKMEWSAERNHPAPPRENQIQWKKMRYSLSEWNLAR